MNKEKKQSSIDPGLFEYNPKEADENEVMEDMARMGWSPDLIVDPKERAAYIKFLETFDADAE